MSRKIKDRQATIHIALSRIIFGVVSVVLCCGVAFAATNNPYRLPPVVSGYSITRADDWPMFVFMFGLLGAIFVFMWALVVGLIIYIHKDLIKRLGNQRREDKVKCDSCKNSTDGHLQDLWDHLELAVWKAIDSCCPRNMAQRAKRLIKKKQELAGDL